MLHYWLLLHYQFLHLIQGRHIKNIYKFKRLIRSKWNVQIACEIIALKWQIIWRHAASQRHVTRQYPPSMLAVRGQPAAPAACGTAPSARTPWVCMRPQITQAACTVLRCAGISCRGQRRVAGRPQVATVGWRSITWRYFSAPTLFNFSKPLFSFFSDGKSVEVDPSRFL